MGDKNESYEKAARLSNSFVGTMGLRECVSAGMHWEKECAMIHRNAWKSQPKAVCGNAESVSTASASRIDPRATPKAESDEHQVTGSALVCVFVSHCLAVSRPDDVLVRPANHSVFFGQDLIDGRDRDFARSYSTGYLDDSRLAPGAPIGFVSGCSPGGHHGCHSDSKSIVFSGHAIWYLGPGDPLDSIGSTRISKWFSEW